MSFRFTATADMLSKLGGSVISPRTYWPRTLQAMKDSHGDEGVFHVTVGDLGGIGEFGVAEMLKRADFDDTFGTDAIWVPVIGNHEFNVGCPCWGLDCTPWLRNEFDGTPLNGRDNLQTSLDATPGPNGTHETNYYWDYGNFRFISLNPYWNGGTGPLDDIDGWWNSNGEIRTALLDWLEPVLLEAQQEELNVILFCHEAAFNDNRKAGDGLDRNIATRDLYWALLEDYDVLAVVNGDSHHYDMYKIGPDTVTGFGGEPVTNGGAWDSTQTKWDRKNNVWQLNLGFAGKYGSGNFQDEHETYSNFVAFDDKLVIEIFQNSEADRETFTLTQSFIIPTNYQIDEYDEYGPPIAESGGGVWYYKQDKPGTEWFDHTDNDKGWTVDFGLKVVDVNDSIENFRIMAFNETFK